MELETFTQTRLLLERERLAIENDPAARQRMYEWISTIERVPRSDGVMQVSMDAAEVMMNQAGEAEELQQISRKWSALEWLQGAIRRLRAG